MPSTEELRILSRPGPWTEKEYLELLQQEDRRPRPELLDGQLLVTFPVSFDHNNVIGQLWLAFLTNAPRGELAVLGTPGVRVNSERYFHPDLAVRKGSGRGIVFNDVSDIVLAAEVVSPSTRRRDRHTKPQVYAEAGIPWYLRVELEIRNAPEIFAYRLEGGRYVEYTRAHAGQQFHLDEPIPVTLDPADLLDYWLPDNDRT